MATDPETTGAAPSDVAEDTRGHVVWHSSEEDGGPDVGLSLGLGAGRVLWVGEITRQVHEDGGEATAALGNDNGWWLMFYPDGVPLARFTSGDAAREFFDAMEAVTNGR